MLARISNVLRFDAQGKLLRAEPTADAAERAELIRPEIKAVTVATKSATPAKSAP
ncbi:hypothetical protein [Oleiharenicola lentus]|uniref:hypothetical protein n=1 Tax=Oleiharenicola lentus TaxID=2508720 RepID=UPI003F67E380